MSWMWAAMDVSCSHTPWKWAAHTHVLDVSCSHTPWKWTGHTRPGSLIPRPSLPPVFDCLQYAKTHTASDQILEGTRLHCAHTDLGCVLRTMHTLNYQHHHQISTRKKWSQFFPCSFFLEPRRQVCCGHPLHNQVILHFTVIYAGNIWLLRTFSSQWMNLPPLVLTLYPSCLHTTLVSVLSQPPPHTVPHTSLMQTSTVPALARGPLTNRSAPLVQFWTAVYRE